MANAEAWTTEDEAHQAALLAAGFQFTELYAWCYFGPDALNGYFHNTYTDAVRAAWDHWQEQGGAATRSAIA